MMKRSDMLKLIENYLDIICPDRFIYNDDRAKDILRIIEEAGMSPPSIIIKIPNNEYGCIEYGYDSIETNEWEEE